MKPLLYKTFLSTPSPGLGNVQKTRRLSMKSGVVIKVNGSWKESLTKFRLTKNWSFGVWSALDVTLLSKLYQTHQVFKHPIYERLYFRGEAETSWGDVFPNWMKRSSHVHAENDNEMLIVLVSAKLEVCQKISVNFTINFLIKYDCNKGKNIQK